MTLKMDATTDDQSNTGELTVRVPQDLDAEKRLRLSVALFDAGLLTQGQAAQMSGLSRVEFYDALGRFGVTPFQYTWEEAVEDADQLETRRQRQQGTSPE
jgi:predicted HTH domain antitoxin